MTPPKEAFLFVTGLGNLPVKAPVEGVSATAALPLESTRPFGSMVSMSVVVVEPDSSGLLMIKAAVPVPRAGAKYLAAKKLTPKRKPAG